MKKLASWLKEQKITEVEAVISDFTGIARGKIMPSNKFIAEKGIRLPESVLIQGVTGDYVDDEVYDVDSNDELVPVTFEEPGAIDMETTATCVRLPSELKNKELRYAKLDFAKPWTIQDHSILSTSIHSTSLLEE